MAFRELPIDVAMCAAMMQAPQWPRPKSDRSNLDGKLGNQQEFVAGEWGLDMSGYEAGREAERRSSLARENAWRVDGEADRQ